MVKLPKMAPEIFELYENNSLENRIVTHCANARMNSVA